LKVIKAIIIIIRFGVTVLVFESEVFIENWWWVSISLAKSRGLLYPPWQPLGIPSAITPLSQLYQSLPSPIPGDLERGPSHQSHVLEHRDTYGQAQVCSKGHHGRSRSCCKGFSPFALHSPSASIHTEFSSFLSLMSSSLDCFSQCFWGCVITFPKTCSLPTRRAISQIPHIGLLRPLRRPIGESGTEWDDRRKRFGRAKIKKLEFVTKI